MLTNYWLEHHIQNLLFDVREREYLEVRDQNWLVREIFPLLIKSNIRFAYLAYLVSQSGFKLMDKHQVHDLILTQPESKTANRSGAISGGRSSAKLVTGNRFILICASVRKGCK